MTRTMAMALVLAAGLAVPAAAGDKAPDWAPFTWDPDLTIAAEDIELAGRTNVYYDEAQGFQVEFTAANGEAWLWYPGESEIVSGGWQEGEVEGKDLVCFGYDPSTAIGSGGTDCFARSDLGSYLVQSAKGDVYGLGGGGTVPWVREPLDIITLPPASRPEQGPAAERVEELMPAL